MDEENKKLLKRKESLLWGARPGRDGTPYSYKKTETLLDVIDAKIQQHKDSKEYFLKLIDELLPKYVEDGADEFAGQLAFAIKQEGVQE